VDFRRSTWPIDQGWQHAPENVLLTMGDGMRKEFKAYYSKPSMVMELSCVAFDLGDYQSLKRVEVICVKILTMAIGPPLSIEIVPMERDLQAWMSLERE